MSLQFLTISEESVEDEYGGGFLGNSVLNYSQLSSSRVIRIFGINSSALPFDNFQCNECRKQNINIQFLKSCEIELYYSFSV